MIKGEMQRILEEVRENHRKLDACPAHDFPPWEPKLWSKYRCTRCGGEIDSIARKWYGKGVEHGKRS